MKEAQEYAAKVFEFIKHNKIDVKKMSMEDIVKGYQEAQIKSIESEANKLEELLKAEPLTYVPQTEKLCLIALKTPGYPIKYEKITEPDIFVQAANNKRRLS